MLGEVVRELREEHGWSRVDLASASGVSVPTISRLELYDVVPGVDLLGQLAEALGTSAGGLLTVAEDRVSAKRDTARKRARSKARK